MSAGTELDPQFKRLQIGLANDRLKTEAQRFRIYGCHFADPDADFARVGPRMEAHLGPHRFQHRIRDSQFVHISYRSATALADARQLIARQHVHNARRTERRSHRYQA
jgi:hypothetical protein